MRYSLVLLLVMLQLAPVGAKELRFSRPQGRQQNLFLADNRAECHLVVEPRGRVVAAFPARDSGVAFWLAGDSHLKAVRLDSSPARSGQTVVATLRSLAPRLVIRGVVLGSIRTIRDASRTPEGARRVRTARQKAAGKKRPDWVRARATASPRRLVFRRAAWDGGSYRLELDPLGSVTIRPRGSDWVLAGKAGFEIRMKASIPFPPLREEPNLLSDQARQLASSLTGAQRRRVRTSLQDLRFLARGGKLLAGSWRFLTYFGRDTLLSLSLLRPVITARAFRDGLQSVLDRLSPDGRVAHEEELGAWAVYLRAARGEPLSSQPIYDYNMVDSELMLPIVLDRGVKRPAKFLERTGAIGESNLRRVLRNWTLVLREAVGPVGRVRIEKGLKVGDWRDSEQGLGGGVYPGDVNISLMPLALEAIARTARAIPSGRLRAACRAMGLSVLPGYLAQAGALARRWRRARKDYQVQLTESQVRRRLRAYLDSGVITPAERQVYLRERLGSTTLKGFLDGKSALPAGLSFYCLSLRQDGSRVEVANTDDCFMLFFGHPSRRELKQTLRLLELPYPVGLMTPVGPVVANPAYCTDRRLWHELGRTAYHGAVVWSWPSAMLEAGLLRQMRRFAADPLLARRIREVVVLLRDAQRRAGPLATSELWGQQAGPRGWKAVPFGGGADQTESNAVQLWSTVYPATLIRLRRAGLANRSTFWPAWKPACCSRWEPAHPDRVGAGASEP